MGGNHGGCGHLPYLWPHLVHWGKTTSNDQQQQPLVPLMITSLVKIPHVGRQYASSNCQIVMLHCTVWYCVVFHGSVLH